MSMEYLDGTKYPHLCESCRTVISQCVELVCMGSDTDDIEAPCNYAYDHQLFCGGSHCDDKP